MAECRFMSNDNLGLTLSSHIYTDNKLRFRLLVPNGAGNYLLYSEAQVFDNDDMVTIAIRRKNNVYQLKIFIELGLGKDGNIWYGTERPPRNLMNNHDIWINTDGDNYVVDKNSYTIYLDESEPLNAILNDIWIGSE